MFKVDAVCGKLPKEKTHLFVDVLKDCRKATPDLVVLNHRLDLGAGNAYTTTTLWGGEAYIDVWRTNQFPATHNRACTVALGVPNKDGKPQRMREDHGVCLSSELDYWEDDLVLQAFSRNMLLSPQIYGSPWFLRDEELPKLARIYNLSRTYRNILVNGIFLDEEKYGKNAISRGDKNTRIVTLRNTEWDIANRQVQLGEEIGMNAQGEIEVRLLHPWEEVLGTFKPGEKVTVPVLPFRAAMIIATSKPSKEVGVVGTPYQVVRDVKDKPVELDLFGEPGTTVSIKLAAMPRKFSSATLDGKPLPELVRQGSDGAEVTFPGKKWTQPWHRKLGTLTKCDVPKDAEALYEATCYAADNNALELRSKARSGETKNPVVQKARDEFFNQKLLVERGVSDQYLFDGDLDTSFRVRTRPIWGSSVRVDLGKPEKFDTLVFERCVDSRQGRNFAPEAIEVSKDLVNWKKVPLTKKNDKTVKLLENCYSIEERFEYPEFTTTTYRAALPADVGAVRYVRVSGTANAIAEIYALQNGKKIDRANWRASNLFAPYAKAPAKHAWKTTVELGEDIVPGAYLVVPCHGDHGRDGVYAALKVDGQYVGAPRRAASYPANPWEYGNRRPTRGLSYFFPITNQMRGKKLEVVVLQFESEDTRKKVELGNVAPEVWTTTYPVPFVKKRLVLK